MSERRRKGKEAHTNWLWLVGKVRKALVENQVKANRTKGPKIYAKLKKKQNKPGAAGKGTKGHTHNARTMSEMKVRICSRGGS